jgi:hypothetical protein
MSSSKTTLTAKLEAAEDNLEVGFDILTEPVVSAMFLNYMASRLLGTTPTYQNMERVLKYGKRLHSLLKERLDG